MNALIIFFSSLAVIFFFSVNLFFKILESFISAFSYMLVKMLKFGGILLSVFLISYLCADYVSGTSAGFGDLILTVLLFIILMLITCIFVGTFIAVLVILAVFLTNYIIFIFEKIISVSEELYEKSLLLVNEKMLY